MSATDSPVSMDTSEMNVIFVHSAIDDYPLTPEEFRVYSHIARRAGLGEAWPKVETVAKACRIHPDTARRCLHNLIEYGLIAATERKGKTTLYRITRPSVWKKPETALAIQQAQASANKARRATKKAAKEISEADPSLQTLPLHPNTTPPFKHYPSETEGGHPSETKGGHPSETKGDEVTPRRGSTEGDPIQTPSVAHAPGGEQQPPPSGETPPNPKQPEPAGPVQADPPPTANAEPGIASDKKNVPGAAGGAARAATAHQAMMDAIRVALYPGVERCADKIEARLAAASKELRSAGLGADAPAGILSLIRQDAAWRKSITPETLVDYSAQWSSVQPGHAPALPVPVGEAQPKKKDGFLR